eukprot:jgi/Botrbrau1/11754/Bobra.0195s0079.1
MQRACWCQRPDRLCYEKFSFNFQRQEKGALCIISRSPGLQPLRVRWLAGQAWPFLQRHSGSAGPQVPQGIRMRDESYSQTPLLQDWEEDKAAEKIDIDKEVEDRGLCWGLIPAWSRAWPLFWPALLHGLSVIIQGEGLRYVTASVSQMIAGSCIIFTALLAVLVIKCRLNWLHLAGITLCMLGTMVVSLVSIWFPAHKVAPTGNGLLRTFWEALGAAPHHFQSWEMALGVSLTLLSQVVLALRLILEEIIVSESNLHPLELMGYEGFLGSLQIAAVGLPLAYVLPGDDPGGRRENTWDSLVMLAHSLPLSLVNGGFFLSVVGLNVFGLYVTQTLGSVFRAVLLTTRTASVWGVNVLLYKLHVGGGAVGEPWLWPASPLQLAGFLLILAGTLLYAQGSSEEALVKITIEDVTEGPQEEEPIPDAMAPQTAPIQPTGLSRRSLARSGSIARLPANTEVADSIAIPRTFMLVPGDSGSFLSRPSLLSQASWRSREAPCLPLSREGSTAVEAAVGGPGSLTRVLSIPGRRDSGRSPGLVETLMAPSSWVNSASSQMVPASSFANRVRNLARRSLGAHAEEDEDAEDGR